MSLDAETARWRRQHTFGGFLWSFPHDEPEAAPRPERKPLQGRELMAEVEHLVSFRVHPIVIAEQLGRPIESIRRAAKASRNRRVMDAFKKSAVEVA